MEEMRDIDANNDVSKTNASIDAVKIDGDIFIGNCTFCSNRFVQNKNKP
jgi:hypothetical protein